jgi:hypothetical protein
VISGVAFSIRESDRWVEADAVSLRYRNLTTLSVSASRIVGLKR